MAICVACGNDMRDGVGCAEISIELPDGSMMPQVPYGRSEALNCHDCNCPPGSFHHFGCDMERCHQCGGQLLFCSCFDEPGD